MNEKPNIISKMSEVEKSIPTIAKGKKVSTGASSFQAVGKDDILEHVNAGHAKEGIKCNISFEIINSSIQKKEAKGGYQQLVTYVDFKATGKFINTINPEDYVELTAYGQGIDSGDKAFNKGQSYAAKNLYIAAYNIRTGEATDEEKKDVEDKKVRKSIEAYINEKAPEQAETIKKKIVEELGASHFGALPVTKEARNVANNVINKMTNTKPKEESKKI